MIIFPCKGAGEGAQTAHRDDYLTSLGFGFKINLPKDLSLRIAWGFSLFYNRHEDRHKLGRFHFDLNFLIISIIFVIQISTKKRKKGMAAGKDCMNYRKNAKISS